MSVSSALRLVIEMRADDRCEYCRAPKDLGGYRFHIEHIVPIKIGGTDDPTNLALACAACNLAKSTKTSGIDPTTGLFAELFNPRSHRWLDHFRWRDQQELEGLTAVGRVTVLVLQMNSAIRAEARVFWFEVGTLP